MRRQLCGLVSFSFFVCALLTAFPLRAQEPRDSERTEARKESPKLASPRSTTETHRFWDKTNVALFAGVGTVRALDYTSTRHFRARGVDEWLLTNRIVDNKPLFIGMEAAGVAASIGLAYWLHKTGHHKLERWLSIIHISVGGFGSARNYTLGSLPPGSLSR